MKNEIINQMNKEQFIVLKPGEVWRPYWSSKSICSAVDQTNDLPEVKNCTVHEWVTQTIFRFDMTYCKKCGLEKK